VKITEISVSDISFPSMVGRDADGMISVGTPGVSHAVMLRVRTDDGVEGRYIEDDVMVVDQLRTDPFIIRDIVAPALIGEDPRARERLWQRLSRLQRLHLTRFHDRILAVADVALWDLLGNLRGEPVHQLVGTFRESVPAYASTMMGEARGSLSTPAGFADFAEQLKERGFPAFKLHTWAPLVSGEADWRRDAEACEAVRGRVGSAMELMLDPWHFYDRVDAYRLGRVVQDLDFFWYEEPMAEASIEDYVWLCERLDIPVTGPEILGGGLAMRAEWIMRKACDFVRGGVLDIGGITPMLKLVHLCEATGVPLTLHLGGVASLHILACSPINGWYYERGLLHPEVDFDLAPPWLSSPWETMSADGIMSIPMAPGLGYDLDHDFLSRHETLILTVSEGS